MKLIILLWLVKLIVFGGASTVPCASPDCGEKEFLLKDVKFNIDVNVGELSSRSKTDCNLGPAIPSTDCRDVFKSDGSRSLTALLSVDDESDLDDVGATFGDSLRCNIEDLYTSYSTNGDSPIGVDMHTISGDKISYLSAPQTKCFSFRVRAYENARIVLTSSIAYSANKIELILGSHNNTKISYIKIGESCEFTVSYNRNTILSSYSFTNFWICWHNETNLILGQGDTVIIDKTVGIEVKEPINYIGLGSKSNIATWQITESNCPGCYTNDGGATGTQAKVSCIKVRDTC